MYQPSFSLKDLSLQELEKFVSERGFPAYRARQLFLWLWNKGVDDTAAMSDLPAAFRELIQTEGGLEISSVDPLPDQPLTETGKFLFKLRDGLFTEAVLILSRERATVCVSSQVGCALGCQFCQSGKMGWIRDLTSGEILDQLLFFRKYSTRDITNVVFMGMGEPMLNFDAVAGAASVMNHEAGFNIGARKITVSTAGVIPGIKRFTELGSQYKLAVSLNSPFQEERAVLMPITKKYPVDELMESVKEYIRISGKRVTFEYVLMDGVNMTDRHAETLIKLLKPLNCKLNIIPYNETDSDYRRPSDGKIRSFERKLMKAPFPVMLRWSGGRDKNAACGQLYYKHQRVG